MQTNKNIVLLHGAGLGSYIWKDVLPLLPYPTLAIDFPNRQNGRANRRLSFQDYTSHAIEAIQGWKTQNLIIVSHSISGCMGLRLAQYLGGRCSGFAAISAAIPKDGRSYLSCFPPVQRAALYLMMQLPGTKAPDSTIRRQFCNGLSAVQAAEVLQRFTPEAKKLYLQPCEAIAPTLPSLYIKCTKDAAMPLSRQAKMAGHLDGPAIRSIDTGHLPMLQQPKELAALLHSFIDTYC